MAAVVVLTRPDGPCTVTLAAGMTAPLSSLTCPRNDTACARSGQAARSATGRQYRNFRGLIKLPLWYDARLNARHLRSPHWGDVGQPILAAPPFHGGSAPVLD